MKRRTEIWVLSDISGEWRLFTERRVTSRNAESIAATLRHMGYIAEVRT